MDSSSKPPGSITFLLVGIVLLAITGTVLLLPLVECPEYCSDAGASSPNSNTTACSRCKGHRRISLWDVWRSKEEGSSEGPWAVDGKEISGIAFVGFSAEQVAEGEKVFGLKRGDRITGKRALNATCRIWQISALSNAEIVWHEDPSGSNKTTVTITAGSTIHRESPRTPSDKLAPPEEKK